MKNVFCWLMAAVILSACGKDEDEPATPSSPSPQPLPPYYVYYRTSHDSLFTVSSVTPEAIDPEPNRRITAVLRTDFRFSVILPYDSSQLYRVPVNKRLPFKNYPDSTGLPYPEDALGTLTMIKYESARGWLVFGMQEDTVSIYNKIISLSYTGRETINGAATAVYVITGEFVGAAIDSRFESYIWSNGKYRFKVYLRPQ